MSTLLYGIGGPVPTPVDDAVTTVTTVDPDNDQPAVQEHPTDFNETFVDPDTGGGLTSRQVASFIIPSERYVPNVDASANSEHSEIVNRQVSTSGVAAAKEATGAWGHGTMKIVEGIEPALRDGNQLGSDYFTAGQHDVSRSSGDYMTPSQPADPDTRGDAAATAAVASRNAARASMYQQYLADQIGF